MDVQSHLVLLQVLLIGVVDLLSSGCVVDGVVEGISELHHFRVELVETGSDGSSCIIILLLSSSQMFVELIQNWRRTEV